MVKNIQKRLNMELIFIALLCIISISMSFLALSSFLKPDSESVASWFQRSGAVTTVFAVFCQFRINNFLEKIRGGTFGESWALFHLFKKSQSFLSYFITIIAIYGSIVWGYGDLIIKYFQIIT